MNSGLRVAFFPDSHHEINGVAHTARHFVEFARANRLEMLCVRAGPETRSFEEDSVAALELRRGPVSFALDHEMRFDLLLWRYVKQVTDAVRRFEPDVIHITGPSDIGQLGAVVAHSLRIPLLGSWHTNLHDFAGRRLHKVLSFTPPGGRDRFIEATKRGILDVVLRFYKIPRVLMAPNEELAAMLETRTGKPTYIMRRGVDTELFTPSRRTAADSTFRLGFVGRLTPEKDVRFLVEIEKALLAAGKSNFRFLIVGAGSERVWLEKNLQRADFTGLLKGVDLAGAYANMDAFVFPSRSDTFGNVVLEAMASGVPPVVTDQGGPKFLVNPGVSGYVAHNDVDFIGAIEAMMASPALHQELRVQARRQACGADWSRVFNKVYEAYGACLRSEPRRLAPELRRPVR